jgi:predicted GIY-YIG superfamily endonuclease
MTPRHPSVPYAEGLAKLPTVLYRCFAGDGELLYIGIARDLERRMKQHLRDHEHDDGAWIHWVDRTEVEQYPDRPSALKAEKAAIAAESPRYNRTGKAVPRLPRVRGPFWRGWRPQTVSDLADN